MNKKELVRIVAKVTNMTTKDVEMVLVSAFEVIMLSISRGEVVRLVGFGSFRFYEKQVVVGLGEACGGNLRVIRIVKFSPGKFFKEILNLCS